MLAPLALAVLLHAQQPYIATPRMEGHVRAIYNADHRWVVMLLDVSEAGAPPDGKVEVSYMFDDLEGTWPLGARWEGNVTIQEYRLEQQPQQIGVGITTPTGIVQLFYKTVYVPSIVDIFRDRGALATLTFRDGRRATGGRPSFDEAEKDNVEFAEISYKTLEALARRGRGSLFPRP